MRAHGEYNCRLPNTASRCTWLAVYVDTLLVNSDSGLPFRSSIIPNGLVLFYWRSCTTTHIYSYENVHGVHKKQKKVQKGAKCKCVLKLIMNSLTSLRVKFSKQNAPDLINNSSNNIRTLMSLSSICYSDHGFDSGLVNDRIAHRW